MTNIKIKFLEPGRWMDEPSKPIFEVAAGEEREVSARLAKIATDAGRAEFVRAKPEPEPEPEPETGPVPKAERNKPGPKPKAERKA